jgi:hypothetical protein
MTISLFDSASEEALSVPEQDQLAILEQTIERGLKTFMDVGIALMVVRDSRLYRQGYATFEAYCRERWGFTRMRASQLIAAVEVATNVNPGLQIGEKHLRPLTSLEPEQQREAWQRAVDTAPNGKVTAAHVQRVVDEYAEQAEELAESEDGYDWMPPPGRGASIWARAVRHRGRKSTLQNPVRFRGAHLRAGRRCVEGVQRRRPPAR